jgi:hypothetical protein
MLSVANKPIVLSVIMPSFVMLNEMVTGLEPLNLRLKLNAKVKVKKNYSQLVCNKLVRLTKTKNLHLNLIFPDRTWIERAPLGLALTPSHANVKLGWLCFSGSLETIYIWNWVH